MSLRVGRNAHCPCGSRKKYKKCCMPPEERSAPDPRHQSPMASAENAVNTVAPTPRPRLHPYVLARAVEESEKFAELKRTDPLRAAQYWTPGRLAAMETESIVARLGELGIDGSPRAYAKAADRLASAWSVSDGWVEQAGDKISKFDDDFLGLAACELWKRYLPDRPSVEMLDDWMQEGYVLDEAGEFERACDRWLEVWAALRNRLRPEMRMCDQADQILVGTQCLYNWLQDLELALTNASPGEPRFARAGIELCEDVLAQFRGEDGVFLGGFRAQLGSFHILAGEPEEGERILREIIQQQPDKALGYVRLACALGFGRRPGEPAIDPDRAVGLLRQALARPVRDASDYDIEAMIVEIQETVGLQPPGPVPSGP